MSISTLILAATVATAPVAPVPAVTMTDITSKTATVGDTVRLSNGQTATVTHVQPRRNRARDGELTLTVDGTTCTLSVRGKSIGADILAAGAWGLGGLFAKGAHAKIDAGTPVPCATNAQPDTWQLVTEQADGSSDIADSDMSADDCNRAADALATHSAAPVIYCERMQ